MTQLAALLVCCAFWGASQEAPRHAPTPYKDGRKSPSTFEGPGRELPEPEDIREILIGYYGPADNSHPDGGSLWQGATLAMEEANRFLEGMKGKIQEETQTARASLRLHAQNLSREIAEKILGRALQ